MSRDIFITFNVVINMTLCYIYDIQANQVSFIVKTNEKLQQIGQSNEVNMGYWAQFSRNEILELHGIEVDNLRNDDIDLSQEKDETDLEDFYCKRCMDAGCYMCNLD
jgi:hypothetical protein